MEHLKEKIAHLINKAEWTDEEKQWLLRYLEDTNAGELEELLGQLFEYEKHRTRLEELPLTREMLQNIHKKIGLVKKMNKPLIFRRWMLGVAAAVVAGLLVLGANALLTNTPGKEIARTYVPAKPLDNKEILPGGNKAVLTLANGSTIVLDDVQNGDLTRQGSAKLLKFNGRLSYQLTGENDDIFYNTVSTPRGGQYQIALPDGSVVWLNAASSLRFPTAFVGKDRSVAVTGEAYFEVAKNMAMPFIVKVNDSEVRVSGTRFNVMAYSEEAALETTLLEGKVTFVNAGTHNFLKPRQQSRLTINGAVKVIDNVNVDGVVAWKNGNFDFEGAGIESVTKQLARWYDVEIVYDKKTDERFYAKIPRSTKLRDVLKALELTGKVQFTIEGKKIVVRS